MQTKLCPTCKQEKPVSEFASHKKASDGLNWQCRDCHKERMYAQRERNKSKVRDDVVFDKRCSTCHEIKKSYAFNVSRLTADGRTNVCKVCEKRYKESRRQRYKEANCSSPPVHEEYEMKKCSSCQVVLPVGSFTRASDRKDGLKPICRDCASRLNKEWKRNNYAKALLKSVRNGAEKRGLEFSITLEDVFIPNVCPVFGTEFSFTGSRDNRPSIDRIRNDVGYVQGNIVVVSMRANRTKSDLSLDELRMLLKFYEQFD